MVTQYEVQWLSPRGRMTKNGLEPMDFTAFGEGLAFRGMECPYCDLIVKLHGEVVTVGDACDCGAVVMELSP